MRWATLLPLSKIDQDESEGGSIERVATDLVDRLNGLFRAQAVLADGGIPEPSVRDLAVAADALEAGVTEEVLLQIQRTSPGDRGVVATAVLTALVQLGHVPEHALARVQGALSRGPQAMANLLSETARQGRARGIQMRGLPEADRESGMRRTRRSPIGSNPNPVHGSVTQTSARSSD